MSRDERKKYIRLGLLAGSGVCAVAAWVVLSAQTGLVAGSLFLLTLAVLSHIDHGRCPVPDHSVRWLEDLPGLILVMDHEGRVTFINEYARRFFEVSDDAAVGRSGREIAGFEESVFARMIDAVGQGEEATISSEAEHVRSDGTRVWVSWTSRSRKGGFDIVVIGKDITDWKRAEEAEQEQRRLLDLAVRGAYLGMVEWDIVSGVMTFNDIWYQMLGYASAEFEARRDVWEAMLHPDDRVMALRVLSDYLDGKRPYYISEYRLRAKDGSWRWVLDRSQIVERDADKRPLRMVGLYQDITVRKRAEAERERLLRSLHRLTAVIDNTSAGVVISNLDGQIIYINDAGAKMHGAVVGEILDQTTRRELHPRETAERIEQEYIAHAIREGVWAGESSLLRRDGRTIPVFQVLIPIRDDDGQVEAIGTTMTDISEIKRFQQALHEQASRLEEAQSVARLGYWQLDIATQNFMRSEIVDEIFGADPAAERTYQDILKRIHPDDRQWVNQLIADSIAGGGSSPEMVFRIIRHDGEIRYVHGKCHTVLSEGKAVRCVGTVQDITPLKTIEHELRSQKDVLSTLIENMPIGIYAKDVRSGYQMMVWNKRMEELSGIPRAEVLGHSGTVALGDGVETADDEADQAVVSGRGVRRVAHEVICGKNGERHVDLIKVPIYGETGDPRLLFGLVEDITERQQMEMELRQTQKMQAIGQLAAGVAHEVKNPLAIILLAAEGLAMARAAGDEERVSNKVRMIKDAAERANRVVLELLRFSRISGVDLETVDIHGVLDGAELLARNKAKEKDIVFIKEYMSGPLTVQGNEVLLEQIFVNLLNNAIDAIEKTGEIRIRTALSRRESDGAEEAVIQIQDNGMGIPQDIADKIFNPFFTTKDPGQGTGLGLSTAFMIIERHNGAISVESQDGRGAVFTVTLPYFVPQA